MSEISACRYPIFETLGAVEGNSTARIQAAIDAAGAAGGGSVVLAAGRHLAGGLQLVSRVDLVLREGAVLAAETEYAAFANNKISVIAEQSDRAFILASGVHDAGIVGPGSIDGGSDAWSLGWDESIGTLVPATRRPRLLVVENSSNVRMSDFHIVMAPMWTIHLIESDHLCIERVTIDNDRRLPNNDGIVIDGCQEVSVSACAIRTADDGICLKTSLRHDGHSVKPCRHVCVKACSVSTRSCAFKIGTETFADITDVEFIDCLAMDSNRGIGLISRDGGVIERVRFENIRVDCQETPLGFWGSGEAITFSALNRRPEHAAGEIRDVLVAQLSGKMEGALVLYAERAGLISTVSFESIRLEQRLGALGTANQLDLRPTAADLHVPKGAEGRSNSWVRLENGAIAGLLPYPGGLPGLYAHSVKDLRLDSVAIQRPQPLPLHWNTLALIVEDE